MTDEQIKQNAEAYACPENSCLSDIEKERVMTHFIAGAHSRDEEIKELEERIHVLELGEKVNEYFSKAKEDRLRHPWISVEDRLPEKAIGKSERSEYVLCRHKNGSYYVAYWHVGLEYWYSMPYKIDKSNITHWMLIPELKKGN